MKRDYYKWVAGVVVPLLVAIIGVWGLGPLGNQKRVVVTPPVVVALPGTEKKILRGLPTATELTLKGNSLNGATVEAPADVEGIKITEQTVNDAGDEIKIKLTVGEEVDLGRYRLKVTTPNGSTDVEIEVVEPTPVAGEVCELTKGADAATAFVVSGANLQSVNKIEALDASGTVAAEIVFSDINANAAGNRIDATAKAAANATAGSFKLRLTDPGGTVDTQATIRVVDPPSPTATAGSIGSITIGAAAKEVTVSGTALKPVTKIEALDASGNVAAGIVFSEINANSAGTQISAKAKAAAGAKAETYKLRLTHPGDPVDTEATIEVVAATPAPTP